ncbi:GPP34 family phosphoprotein [Streptomyces sp. G-G2]|uniref:GOLPH3/VPS74 family protein n=1 Tax=Streptomyces sp. G-G2 TaxID=3046201 RepID=UPI0024BBACFB|nr:GPP34 family phosphoprotein [Streptomyces sp. G-G2]MDJ0385596.1 GPP34 family phosphoprotein [Streptomyces sp. G-G2]
MTTAKDLFIIAMDPRPDRSVGQGDLSLALAGAELIDLIGAHTVTLDGERIVPDGARSASDDQLLGEASAALARDVPYESVEDWLWRRGRDLSAAYQSALEGDGQLTRERRRSPFGPARVELVDSAARRRALSRWEADEPVLAALASAVGIRGGRSGEDEGDADDGSDGDAVVTSEVTAVLAVVNDAVMELEAVRQRRNIEKAAFANIWRGP